jgi:hypothetical protein
MRPLSLATGLFGLLSTCTIVTAAGSVPANPYVQFTKIALTGEPAPGFGGGVFLLFPQHNLVNNAGQVVFLGIDGVFAGSSSSVQAAARAGQQAPGYPAGITIGGFDINYHRINSAGQIVFEGYLAGPGIDPPGDSNTNALAQFAFFAGQLTTVAQSQTPAPGAGADFHHFADISNNDLGHVAFRAGLSGPGVTGANDTSVWYGPPTAPALIAREGSPAPGGGNFGNMAFDQLSLSPGGRVLFASESTSPFSRSIFAGTPNNLQLIAKTGGAAPGGLGNYFDFRWHSPGKKINDAGQVIFDSNTGTGSGIFVGTAGNIAVLARSGVLAPGAGGAQFVQFNDEVINAQGKAAINADLSSGSFSRQGIFAGTPGNVSMIALAGLEPPGTGPGTFFNDFNGLTISDSGQVAFFGYITGPNSRGPDDAAIFATDSTGQLHLVARHGDQFEISPGDIRTIEDVSYDGVFGTHIQSMNQSGELSMFLRFTNGSQGVFVVQVVPEPAYTTLIGVSLVCSITRRRRRICP